MPAKESPQLGKLWVGAPSLTKLLVRCDTLSPHPKNPRRGDVEQIAGSLRRFGQVRPILVREEGLQILAGNHTFLAARDELGWTHIAANVASMTEREAEAYMLADNRLAELASYDEAALAELFQAARSDGMGDSGLEGTGWAPQDVTALLEPPQRTPAEPRLPQSGEQRSTVLEFDADQHGRFHERVGILAREWGEEGVSEVVYRAVAEAVQKL